MKIQTVYSGLSPLSPWKKKTITARYIDPCSPVTERCPSRRSASTLPRYRASTFPFKVYRRYLASEKLQEDFQRPERDLGCSFRRLEIVADKLNRSATASVMELHRTVLTNRKCIHRGPIRIPFES